MARELPGKFQQRLPYDLLSAIAKAMLDGTAFEIVKSLEEVQHLEEKSLFTQRLKLINDHKSQRHEINKKHKELLMENQHKPHNLPLIEAQVEGELETMERRLEEEVKRRDMKIILELDLKLMDQQSMLEKAGVPDFYVTNNRQDVQMYLLEFISRLAVKERDTGVRRKMVALAVVQYGSGAAITALLHPFGYAKVLMQVGHEPLLPERTKTFFLRKEVFVYPNIFKYIGHIRKVDGFAGLYRGVLPRIVAGTLGNLVQYNIQNRIKLSQGKTTPQKGEKSHEQIDEDFVAWLKIFAKETSEETVSRCCGVIVSHPFHVIMVRCMVQFIGRETKYNSMFSSIKEIYERDGILGFFVGLIPRLIGEVIAIWLTSFLTQVLNKYMIQEKDLQSYTGAACGLVVSQFTYPFTLVTNIMAVNNCGLAAGQFPQMPVYSSWFDCMTTLSQEGELKRGASAFWRAYKPHPYTTVFSKGSAYGNVYLEGKRY